MDDSVYIFNCLAQRVETPVRIAPVLSQGVLDGIQLRLSSVDPLRHGRKAIQLRFNRLNSVHKRCLHIVVDELLHIADDGIHPLVNGADDLLQLLRLR